MSAGTIFGKHGLPDSPTSHGPCPLCDRTTIWIPKSGDIAKCFNPECERYDKPWHARARKTNAEGWCIAALNPFSEACIGYLRSEGEGDPLRQKAIDWLVKTRLIAREVIEEVRIGIVPSGLDVERFISLAKESATYTDETNPARIMSHKVEADLAIPLRDHVATKAGWLVFCYEDFNGDVVAVNFRQVETDEQGKNVIRLFNPIGKKGVFNPYLYSGTPRVLIGEGEFNCLRYMSEVVRAYGAEWRDQVQDNVTVGGSSAVDLKTLGALLTHGELGCEPSRPREPAELRSLRKPSEASGKAGGWQRTQDRLARIYLRFFGLGKFEQETVLGTESIPDTNCSPNSRRCSRLEAPSCRHILWGRRHSF